MQISDKTFLFFVLFSHCSVFDHHRQIRRPINLQMTKGGLGIAAMSYVVIDYMRYVSPVWHSRLMPVLWSVLAIAVVTRVLFYKHWSKELRAAIPFLGSIVFLLCALLFEALCVRSVTAVLGLDWHRYCFRSVSI